MGTPHFVGESLSDAEGNPHLFLKEAIYYVGEPLPA